MAQNNKIYQVLETQAILCFFYIVDFGLFIGFVDNKKI